MIYKGCIVKIEEDFAVVLTNTMEYLKVMKKDKLEVGREIMFIEEDLYKEKTFAYRKIAMAAALFMVVISLALFNKIGNIGYGATAVISMDINPSLELQINKNSKVIKIIPLNKDAKELLTDEKLLGKPVEDVVYIIINKSKETRYIYDEKNSVLISTVILKDNINNKNIENIIEKKLKEDKQLNNISRFYVEGKKEDLELAHKEKISIGRYEAFKKIKEKDKNISIESIKKMKVQEIIKKKIEIVNKKIEKPMDQKLDNPEENQDKTIEMENIEEQPKVQHNNEDKQIKIDNKEEIKEIEKEIKEDKKEDEKEKKEEIKEIKKEIKEEVKEIKKEIKENKKEKNKKE